MFKGSNKAVNGADLAWAIRRDACRSVPDAKGQHRARPLSERHLWPSILESTTFFGNDLSSSEWVL